MPEVNDTLIFEFEDSRLTYSVFGNGPAILLAFHGFGQSHRVFQPLVNTVGDRFTILAIDLFLHGSRYVGSHKAGNPLLTKTDWQRLLRAFLRERTIDRFSLMGFSLGGRFALATVEAFADRLDELILIAPDGITRSFWYRLATTSGTGRSLFRFVLRRLPLLHSIGHGLVRLELLNRTAMRFAEISLATPEQRDLVYQTWTQFRLIRPDLIKVSSQLNQRPVWVQFMTGAFDRIVPGWYMLPLTDRLRRYELTVLKTGHNHLIELAGDYLAQRPLDNSPQSDDRNKN